MHIVGVNGNHVLEQKQAEQVQSRQNDYHSRLQPVGYAGVEPELFEQAVVCFRCR